MALILLLVIASVTSGVNGLGFCGLSGLVNSLTTSADLMTGCSSLSYAGFGCQICLINPSSDNRQWDCLAKPIETCSGVWIDSNNIQTNHLPLMQATPVNSISSLCSLCGSDLLSLPVDKICSTAASYFGVAPGISCEMCLIANQALLGLGPEGCAFYSNSCHIASSAPSTAYFGNCQIAGNGLSLATSLPVGAIDVFPRNWLPNLRFVDSSNNANAFEVIFHSIREYASTANAITNPVVQYGLPQPMSFTGSQDFFTTSSGTYRNGASQNPPSLSLTWSKNAQTSTASFVFSINNWVPRSSSNKMALCWTLSSPANLCGSSNIFNPSPSMQVSATWTSTGSITYPGSSPTTSFSPNIVCLDTSTVCLEFSAFTAIQYDPSFTIIVSGNGNPPTPSPRPDCVRGPWENVGVCSSSCGSGEQQQQQTISASCQPGSNTRYIPCQGNEPCCATSSCAAVCEVGEWSEWSPLSPRCGTNADGESIGTQSRTRSVISNGETCPYSATSPDYPLNQSQTVPIPKCDPLLGSQLLAVGVPDSALFGMVITSASVVAAYALYTTLRRRSMFSKGQDVGMNSI